MRSQVLKPIRTFAPCGRDAPDGRLLPVDHHFQGRLILPAAAPSGVVQQQEPVTEDPTEAHLEQAHRQPEECSDPTFGRVIDQRHVAAAFQHEPAWSPARADGVPHRGAAAATGWRGTLSFLTSHPLAVLTATVGRWYPRQALRWCGRGSRTTAATSMAGARSRMAALCVRWQRARTPRGAAPSRAAVRRRSPVRGRAARNIARVEGPLWDNADLERHWRRHMTSLSADVDGSTVLSTRDTGADLPVRPLFEFSHRVGEHGRIRAPIRDVVGGPAAWSTRGWATSAHGGVRGALGVPRIRHGASV